MGGIYIIVYYWEDGDSINILVCVCDIVNNIKVVFRFVSFDLLFLYLIEVVFLKNIGNRIFEFFSRFNFFFLSVNIKIFN